MLEVGKHHILRVLRETRVGCYLGDREGNEVLLPAKYVPQDTKSGDALSVFIYRDGEERLIATTQTPKILLHHFGYLQVKMITQIGAFMDWGLEKDLFVPFREQPVKMITGLSISRCRNRAAHSFLQFKALFESNPARCQRRG